MMTTWNPAQYLRFADERTQPSLDLVARLQISSPQTIIDIGCGPGNSTRVLHNRWPDARVCGLDSSPAMIEAARASSPELNWQLADAATWKAQTPFDLVFSNATLQWLPRHEVLIPHLFKQVARGGALAVQMPAHYASTLHHETLEVAADARWNARTQGARASLTNHSPSFYYDLLQPLAARLELWETEYIHVLSGPQAIVDWFRATGLRPYLEVLTETERADFEAALLEKYRAKYPQQSDGRILFPFRRLFFIAYQQD